MCGSVFLHFDLAQKLIKNGERSEGIQVKTNCFCCACTLSCWYSVVVIILYEYVCCNPVVMVNLRCLKNFRTQFRVVRCSRRYYATTRNPTTAMARRQRLRDVCWEYRVIFVLFELSQPTADGVLWKILFTINFF